MKTLLNYMLYLSLVYHVNAQQICKNTKTRISLKNGTVVHIYKEKNTNASPIFYYVPSQLKLAKKNGKPAYSFLDYKKPGSSTPDGAIFHMLVTWGLNKQELSELKQKIKAKYGDNASLGGAVNLNNMRSRVHLNSNTTIGKILSQSLKSKGAPPSHASGKMALSFRFKKEHVSTIQNALKKPSKLKGTTLNINYTYKTNSCNQGFSVAQNTSTTIKGRLQYWF